MSWWREQIKSGNECAVILAVLISLFVYFFSHLPRHAVPQCFPSSLVRSHCCALMHVLGWCSCPERLSSLFVWATWCCVRARVCVSTCWYNFSFWLSSCGEAIPPVSRRTPPVFDLSVEHVHTCTSRARMSTRACDGWCYYLKLLRGRKVLKRTNTPDCLCLIIRN